VEPKDRIDQWIAQLVPGKSFVDIGGIGVDSVNERTTFAVESGAASVTMADVRPIDYWEWDIFHKKIAQAGVTGIRELGDIDIRSAADLARIGPTDVVHSTGILYHLHSPPEGLWTLRSIVNEYLITNTVTFPGVVTNEFGTVALPDCGVLFLGALTERDRRVLNKYYSEKFGWTVDGMSPRLDDRTSSNQWIMDGKLTPWPNWFFYSDHAFRSLLRLCRLEILDEYKWENHSLQVLCRPEPD
jgi:hypothetical protein